MENVKFKTDLYDLVPNGISFGADQATIKFVMPADKTYEAIEVDVTGNSRFEVLDELGEVLTVGTGYLYLDSLTKQHNYVLRAEPVIDEATGETTYTDVIGTVMIVTLKRSDVREELEVVKAQLDYVTMMSDIPMEEV